jgi:hypothetical protein
MPRTNASQGGKIITHLLSILAWDNRICCLIFLGRCLYKEIETEEDREEENKIFNDKINGFSNEKYSEIRIKKITIDGS